MKIAVVQHEDAASAVVSITGQLDLAGAPAVRAAIARVLADRPRRLVVDLGGVDFLDSSALGVLVSTRNRITADGGTLRVVTANPLVVKILKITGLSAVLDLRATVAEALDRELVG